MAERNAEKLRLCNNCAKPVLTTAKGIVAHEKECAAGNEPISATGSEETVS